MADKELIAEMIHIGIMKALSTPDIINLITESATAKLNDKINMLCNALETNKKLKILKRNVKT